MLRMICQGPNCGQVFEAKTRRAKFCSSRCSVAAYRAGITTSPQVAAEHAAGPGRSDRGNPGRPAPALKFQPRVFETTTAALEKAKRVETWGGQVALWLAALIDAGGPGATSAAQTAREHAAAVERALAAGNEDDPVALRERQVAERLRAVGE